jgi:hypothetical protein
MTTFSDNVNNERNILVVKKISVKPIFLSKKITFIDMLKSEKQIEKQLKQNNFRFYC